MIRDFRSSAENKIASGFFPLQDTTRFKLSIDLANQALAEKARLSEAAFTGRVITEITKTLSAFQFPEPMPVAQPQSFCPVFGNMDSGV